VSLFLNDKDFWRNLYTVLREKAIVSVTKVNKDEESFLSLLKMTGFTNTFYPPSGLMTFQKPEFKTGGTSLKDRRQAKEAEKNPWANLDTKPVLINEDELM
jgi:hypothetical protein